MKLELLYLVFGLFVINSCRSTVEQDAYTNTPASTASDTANTGFTATDSIEVVYYPDPLNQKIYKHAVVADSTFIQELQINLQQASPDGTECTHRLKLYLFRKGEVYKTIYVSDSCNYLAYAINSRQQFVPVEAGVRSVIDSLANTMR